MADVLGTSVSAARFYRTVIQILQDNQIPFLVGGAYALVRYVPIRRRTKDLDLFIRKEDCQKLLDVISKCGFKTEFTDDCWLAKVFSDEYFIDIIFGSRNGIATVDDAWFENAVSGTVFGVEVKLCPPEEVLWSKSFIMERDRFDGADIAKLILSRGKQMDWQRLKERFTEHWQVLLAHVTLYDFIYPHARAAVPSFIRNWLLMQAALLEESSQTECRGHLLAQSQYPTDAPAGQGGTGRRTRRRRRRVA